MSDVAHEQEQQYDGSEGVDLQKEMTGPVFQPEDKVQFGYPTIKQKTYKQCTKKELKDSHEFFSKGDNISNDVQKHLNTIEAELYDRSK